MGPPSPARRPLQSSLLITMGLGQSTKQRRGQKHEKSSGYNQQNEGSVQHGKREEPSLACRTQHWNLGGHSSRNRRASQGEFKSGQEGVKDEISLTS